MIKKTKYTKMVEKEVPVYTSAKVQKIDAVNGTFFLESGDEFQLIPVAKLKEQSIESQAIADIIVNKINANLTDEPIEVKVVADNSETLNGVKTTDITFEICVKEDMQSSMVKMGAEGLDFTEELDAMLNEVIAGEGFTSDEVTSDSITNTFTINKVEVEGVEEDFTTDVGIDLSSDDDVIVGADAEFMDDNIIEDDVYYESVRNSKYTNLIFNEKAKKESEDLDEEDDNVYYARMNIDNTESLYKLAQKVKNAKELKDVMLKNKSKFPDAKKIDFDKLDWSEVYKNVMDEMKKLKKESDDIGEDLDEKNKPKKDKNGKYPFEKGYIKEEDDDDDDEEDDEKEPKEEKKKVKESLMFKRDKYSHLL